MGLGILFRSPVPRRGWLKKEVPVEELWQKIAQLAAQAVGRAGSPLKDWYWSHKDGDRLWLNILPFEENVGLHIADNTVEVSAKTSGAGPGYHEFVVELLDLWKEKLDLNWKPEGDEDDGDETGYWQHRNRELLCERMAHQLKSVAKVIVEHIGAGAMLNMPTDAVPSSRAFASSPMGEWTEEWIRRTASADGDNRLDLAEQFYPWWGNGIGAKELANFGRVLCWTTVRWVRPETTLEEQAIRVAIECLERAQQGGVVGIPELEMSELRRLLEPDADAHAVPSPSGIGFRRRELEMSLPGQWTLRVRGYFHEQTEDNGALQVYWFSGRTIRASTLNFEATRSPKEVLEIATKGKGQSLESLAEGLIGAVETTWDDSDECYLTHISLAGTGSLCMLTFAHTNEADRDWAIEVLSLRSRGLPSPANGWRFRSGRSQIGSRQQDATTARRRKMEAEPRLRAGKTHQHTKADFCKRLLCPAATTLLTAAGR